MIVQTRFLHNAMSPHYAVGAQHRILCGNGYRALMADEADSHIPTLYDTVGRDCDHSLGHTFFRF